MSFCHFYKEEQLLRLTGCFLEQRSPTINRGLDKREYLMILQHKFFLFLNVILCCDPSSEASRLVDDGSQHRFLTRITKTYPYLSTTIRCDPSSEPSHPDGSINIDF